MPFSEVHAVSLKSGDIIATHYRTAEVFLVDPISGDLTVISSGGLLIEPCHVTLDSSGNILVADMYRGVIRIDPISGTQTLISSLDGAFGIAFGNNGKIYVSTFVGTPPNSSAAILKIDPSSGIATVVSSDDNFLIPREIEIDSNGDILVADQGIGYLVDGAIINVNSVTGDQTILSSGGMIATIRGLAIENNDQILVGENSSPPIIIRIDPTTGSQAAVSTGGLFISPIGIALEENGSILVADNGTGAPGDGGIIRIDADTGAQSLLVSAATSNGMFKNGRGITVVPGTGPPIIYSFTGSPITGEVPLSVSFTCVAHDFGGSIQNYIFDTGDGNSQSNANGIFNYEYVTTGTFDATCTATDNDGESATSDSVTINVTTHVNLPPVADCGQERAVVFNEVTFDGTGSTDQDGLVVSYEWTLRHEDGSVITADGPNPTIPNLTRGFYDVTLKVFDNQSAFGTDTMLLAAAGPCVCTPSAIHVASIVAATAPASKGEKYGQVTVNVNDDCGGPVSGVTVSGIFDGDFTGPISGVTGSDGNVILTTTTFTKKPSYSFCVDSLSHALSYDENANAGTCDELIR